MKGGPERSGSGFFVITCGDQEGADLLRKHLESRGGQGSIVGIGHSMEPTLHAGDRVHIKEVSGAVRRGWILVFTWRGRVLTHRVVRIQKRMFWARGDACAEVEGPVSMENVIGRVVAYCRDGKWRQIDGFREQVLGLVVNYMFSSLRRMSQQWPGIRRLVELEVLGGVFARRVLGSLGHWIYGNILLEEDRSRERVIGALVSDSIPLTQRMVIDVEDQINSGNARLIVARSSRFGRIGTVFLGGMAWKGNSTAGYVTALRVSLGVRGMGIGRMLLSSVEETARRDGLSRLVAMVDSDNIRSMAMFRSKGYRVLSDREMSYKPVGERPTLPEGKLLLEKDLKGV